MGGHIEPTTFFASFNDSEGYKSRFFIDFLHRITRNKRSLNRLHRITHGIQTDLALGVGGLPRGRVIEIYGPEAGGKTTLSLHVAAQTQKMGGTVAFIDAEHALDPVYAANLGVNVDELLVSQPDSGEQALEIAEKLVRSGAIDLIVVDSLAVLLLRWRCWMAAMGKPQLLPPLHF